MVYEKLAEKLDQTGLGAPRSEELIRILEALFPLEEAEIALALPFRPTPLERLAALTGRHPADLGASLEAMADRGLVFAKHREKETFYCLLPVLPGIFELQFMKGQEGPRQTWLASLYEQYYVKSLGPAIGRQQTSYARVIPVQRRIASPMQISPYEEVNRYIREGDSFALTQCHCRHQQELIGEGCGAPKDVCMLFGPFAAFAVDRGFARTASREEMLDALDRAEESGLVHVSDNVAERINFLCNCCGCCCGFLRAASAVGRANVVACSPFVATLDADRCVACGACTDRCHVGALQEVAGAMTLARDRCLGCGVCLSACPSEALALRARGDFSAPFPTRTALDARVRSERQR
jgi:Pyruvate/2-oxoacid:ferredoxin oxidoreductase delta subunit